MSTLITSLAIGSVYALIALGYNVIYTTGVLFNFAQGAVVAVSSLLVFTLVVSAGVPVLLAVVVCAAFGAVICALEYVVAVLPIVRRSGGSDLWLVSTLGVSVAVEALAQLIWGPDAHAVPIHALDKLVWVGDAYVPVGCFVAIAAAVAAVVFLDLWYRSSRTGKLMRATAEDGTAAEARGVNTRRLTLLSWAIAGALSGAAAVVVVPLTRAQAGLGDLFAIKAFVAMAIGGFGFNRGALVGGAFVGLVETYGTQWFGPVYADPLVFVLLLLVLLVIPRGLAGRRAERAV